jgi:hypothetical protein
VLSKHPTNWLCAKVFEKCAYPGHSLFKVIQVASLPSTAQEPPRSRYLLVKEAQNFVGLNAGLNEQPMWRLLREHREYRRSPAIHLKPAKYLLIRVGHFGIGLSKDRQRRQQLRSTRGFFDQRHETAFGGSLCRSHAIHTVNLKGELHD